MAKKEAEAKPWERQEGEGPKPFEAFCIYRDMGTDRSLDKVAAELSKSGSLIRRWSSENDWVKRVAAWDDEQDRQAARELMRDIAKTRARQRKQALKMQHKGLELLNGIESGDAKLSEIVSLLKLGMEQERICLGDVGDVIEERTNTEAYDPVQIYIPTNTREQKDTFDDLEV